MGRKTIVIRGIREGPFKEHDIWQNTELTHLEDRIMAEVGKLSDGPVWDRLMREHGEIVTPNDITKRFPGVRQLGDGKHLAQMVPYDVLEVEAAKVFWREHVTESVGRLTSVALDLFEDDLYDGEQRSAYFTRLVDTFAFMNNGAVYTVDLPENFRGIPSRKITEDDVEQMHKVLVNAASQGIIPPALYRKSEGFVQTSDHEVMKVDTRGYARLAEYDAKYKSTFDAETITSFPDVAREKERIIRAGKPVDFKDVLVKILKPRTIDLYKELLAAGRDLKNSGDFEIEDKAAIHSRITKLADFVAGYDNSLLGHMVPSFNDAINDRNKLRSALSKLRQEGYMSHRTLKGLVDLFSEESKLSIRTPSSSTIRRVSSSSLVVEQYVNPDIDQNVEYMVELLGLPEEVAARLAPELKHDELDNTAMTLIDRLGDSATDVVLANPEILLLKKKGDWKSYVRQVDALVWLHPPESNVNVYADPAQVSKLYKEVQQNQDVHKHAEAKKDPTVERREYLNGIKNGDMVDAIVSGNQAFIGTRAVSYESLRKNTRGKAGNMQGFDRTVKYLVRQGVLLRGGRTGPFSINPSTDEITNENLRNYMVATLQR